MYMKVIFLDLDGVLATNKEFYMNERKFKSKNSWANEMDVKYPFNPECVKIFNQILESGYEIVLSSDWKDHKNLDQLKTIFLMNGVKKWPIDVTHSKTVYPNRCELEDDRYYQIVSWVHKNNPEDWISLDDLDMTNLFESNGYKSCFFLTRSSEGLKQCGLKDKILSRLK